MAGDMIWSADAPSPVHRARNHAMTARLACVLALALALRLWGISFGLPYTFHPDELRDVGEALKLAGGQTDALSFGNPALYKYLLVGVFWALVGQERLAAADTSVLYLSARATTAVLGTLTVIAVFWMARLLRGNRAGLIAGGLAAVTFLLVRDAHFGVNDTLAELCATIALACCVRVACRGTHGDYVTAGAALGLAFASKYQALAVVGPLLVAHLQPGHRRRHVDLVLGLGVALLAAVVAFPPMVTEPQRVLGDIYVNTILPSRRGWEGLDPAGVYAYYVKVLGWGIGLPMLTLACIGVGRAVIQRDWPLLVVAILPVSLYAIMGGSHLYFARYLLPAVPALIVLAAVVLADLGRRAPLAAPLLAVIVVAWTLPNTVQFDTLLTRTDTRTAARAWVAANLPAGARVLAERVAEGPPLAQLQVDVVYPGGTVLYEVPLADYRKDGIEYVVTSSFTADAPNLTAARTAQRREFYASLQRDAVELVEFLPYRSNEPEFVYDRLYGT